MIDLPLLEDVRLQRVAAGLLDRLHHLHLRLHLPHHPYVEAGPPLHLTVRHPGALHYPKGLFPPISIRVEEDGCVVRAGGPRPLRARLA